MSDPQQTAKPKTRAVQRGLGRGLSALMDDYPLDEGHDTQGRAGGLSGDGVRVLPIHHLMANPFQPRRIFDAEELQSLADSIREKGVLQPILVRKSAKDGADGPRYEIIAGERRWRASQKAGLHDVPVLVRDLDDRAALEVAIIENIQRRDLSAIEEAQGYLRLIDDFGHKQDEIAKAVGKSRSHIANLLRLLSLPEAVRHMVDDGRLSMGHARALIGTPDPLALAKKAIEGELSVRAVEKLVHAQKDQLKAPAASQSSSPSSAGHKPGTPRKDADTRALEQDLSQSLGLVVSIDHKGDAGGQVTIRYASLEQLDDLCQALIER
ncbi:MULTISPECIES: ParB/RepB/Spo0J family partition protein [unclassified Iodidimonas]|jgi:ParB family chromosome partitioning protein|uniref:ParB/RepB/Spo0J family partition protein n=1 Tax=unclassified Iodidimonas TaxID=2626145 RepID=UPI002482DFE3|nr:MULTISPECIES: ParB/RepB/Spo0J family partition protein [unclassified Iodidimonas]